MIQPFRASHYKNGYAAEFLPAGERTWRLLKSGGVAIVFPTSRAALSAAENAYIARMEPKIRSTLPVNPDRLAAKLTDDAENWLRSKREHVKQQNAVHRPGKRPFVVLQGKVQA